MRGRWADSSTQMFLEKPQGPSSPKMAHTVKRQISMLSSRFPSSLSSVRLVGRFVLLWVMFPPLLLSSLSDISEWAGIKAVLPGTGNRDDGVPAQSSSPLCTLLYASAQLRILSPKSLADFFQNDLKDTGGVIPGSTAAFGAPMYGEVIVGRLIAYNSPLCDENEKNLKEYGLTDSSSHSERRLESPNTDPTKSPAKDFSQTPVSTPLAPATDTIGKTSDQSPVENSVGKTQKSVLQMSDSSASPNATDSAGQEPRILVVERGDCTFVKKAHNAEKLGAVAMIVVDSTESKWKRPDIRHVILSGNIEGAANIDIPSLMVTNEDGRRLLEAIKKGDHVYASLEWSLPVRDTVDIDFWADPASPQGTAFLVSFAQYARKLKGRVRFVLRFYLFDLPEPNSLCLSVKNVNFCANAPATDLTDPKIAGSDIVREDLRQLCLLKHTSAEIPTIPGSLYSEAFWEYVEQWGKECQLKGGLEEMHRFGSACSDRILQSLDGKNGLDVQKVKACMADEDESFRLLQSQVDNLAWGELAMRINEIAFSGRLESSRVARAACSAFAVMPESCKSVLRDIRQARGSRETNAGDKWGSGLGLGIIWGSGTSLLVVVLTVILLLALAAFFYQRHLSKTMRQSLREEVMLEVRTQMQEYQQMPEDVTEERAMRSHTESRPLIF